jgi:serine/threonine-protein kinase HipA
MKRCLITYEPLQKGESIYSSKGLRSLNPKLIKLNDFPYSRPQQIKEAQKLAGKMSIQGVQPKLSLKLNIKEQKFEICERGGTFILKPQSPDYTHMPENEDVTMKMAKLAGIEVPWHGLIHCEDGSLSYAIKRFDRAGKSKKLALEDFAQLIGADRQTKYDVSLERVAEVLEQFCTYPTIEAVKLFRILVFSFLVGNEDQHLKNFSLITRNGKVQLSPAYDLLNSTIVLASPQEEFALTMGGKKKGFKRKDFIQEFGMNHLFLPQPKLEKEMDQMLKLIPQWEKLLEISFLPKDQKEEYADLLKARAKRLMA